MSGIAEWDGGGQSGTDQQHSSHSVTEKEGAVQAGWSIIRSERSVTVRKERHIYWRSGDIRLIS